MKPLHVKVLGVAVILVGGCASPSPPAQVFDHAAHQVQWGGAHLETNEWATLPIESDLSGANPLGFYVQIALERNPEILAAEQGVAAQAEVIPQVTSLDDPMLVETFQPITSHSVQTAGGRGPNLLTLSQRFPWFGKLRVRGEVAEQQTQIALTRLAQRQLKVTEEVHLAYYELYFNQQAIDITQENEALLRDLLKIAEARLSRGTTSQQDLLRAEVELDRVQDRLISLRRQFHVSQADLAKLLHTSPEAELMADDTLDLPSLPAHLDHLYEAAVSCRPELQERLHDIVRDQWAEELAHLQYYPDVTLGLGWQAITTDNALAGVANGNDNLSFSVGINLPIWQDRLRAGVREAEYRASQSAQSYDAVRDDTFRLIKRLTVQARAINEQLHLFRDSILPKAEQTLRVSTADYTVGKVDFQQIIENWTGLLAFQLQVERLRASLGQTLASLERVVGCQIATLPESADDTSGAVRLDDLE